MSATPAGIPSACDVCARRNRLVWDCSSGLRSAWGAPEDVLLWTADVQVVARRRADLESLGTNRQARACRAPVGGPILGRLQSSERGRNF
jgi:hypothetical protein